MIITGRVWVFGDDINTDLIMPHNALRLPLEEQAKFVFSDNRPGWAAKVEPGDIIVAGKNFGTGSARPGSIVLKQLGIAGMLADSMNGVFFRNCIGYGFPSLQCKGVSEMFDEGDLAEFNLETGEIKNITKGTSINAIPISGSMIETIEAGGIDGLLRKKGLMK